ncbi:MAG: TRAP transporter small permease [Synoicihabitans sp.]
MSPADEVMKRILDRYYLVLKTALTILMGLLIVPVVLQIVSRYTGIIPRWIWTEEIARFCFVWMVMIGAMIAVRDKAHFEVDMLPSPRTARGRRIADMVVHGVMFLMAVAFVRYGYDFARFGLRQTSEMSGINMASIYIAFPLAGITWCLFLGEKLVEDFRGLRPTKSEVSS